MLKNTVYRPNYCDPCQNINPPITDLPTYKYELIVYWNKDDEAYIVEVPELPIRIQVRD